MNERPQAVRHRPHCRGTVDAKGSGRPSSGQASQVLQRADAHREFCDLRGQVAAAGTGSNPDGIEATLRELAEKLSPEALLNLRQWLTDDVYAEFRGEIEAMARRGAWTALEDAFYMTIPFGTGGRRGPRGAGPN